MSVLRSSTTDISGLRYQDQRPKAPQLQTYSRETRFPSTTTATSATTTSSNNTTPSTAHPSHNGANGSNPFIESANSESDSELATPPPDSPVIPPREYDIGYSSEEWEEDEAGLMQKKDGKGIQLRRVKDPQASSAPAPITPDQQARNEVFDHLAYGGFLDVKLASLYRWAAGVIWDIQLFRQTRCPAKHPEVANMLIYSTQKRTSRSRPKSPVPPVLYRLFGENALLPDSIRTSATARSLIVLHAIYYMSKLPVCTLCACEESRDSSTGTEGTGAGAGAEEVMPPYAVLDLRNETEVSFGGVSEAIISRVVIDWAVAIRIAIAWLTDTPRGNYWEIHTKHIPDDIGASTTRYFQRVVNYQFGLTNARLMNMIDLITDEHPLALTPPSRIRYSPKNGGVYYNDLPSLIQSKSA
ncbi:hypothetical protein FRC18_012106 [Serendipita sp. 400]|nr:hypothetical protein FRC18_012106 [Serendipita sp. 400]